MLFAAMDILTRASNAPDPGAHERSPNEVTIADHLV
jgi:hypothetical protein